MTGRHDLTLHAGAAALHDLLRCLAATAEANLAAAPDADDDPRDFRAMSIMVRQAIEAGLQHGDPAHRDGFLRALTSLLSIVADGCAPGSDWAPLRETERAFA